MTLHYIFFVVTCEHLEKMKGAKMSEKKLYYWIAINGASCALSSTPMPPPPKLQVIPKPEVLIGFPTLDEAVKVQGICLGDSIPNVERCLKELNKREDVCRVAYNDADAPTRGQTLWSVAGTATDAKHEALMQQVSKIMAGDN